LVEIIDVNDPENKEATEALPTTQPEILEIDEYYFRLYGICTWYLAQH
jgi:hypothetical protein